MNRSDIKLVLFGAALMGMVFAGASTVSAGAKAETVVTIIQGENGSSAEAILGSARNSADATQMLACQLSANSGPTRLACSARDAAGKKLSCYSMDTKFVTVAASIGVGSRVTFRTDTVGNCTGLDVTNSSANRPMTP
jgi:hypothetical protein